MMTLTVEAIDMYLWRFRKNLGMAFDISLVYTFVYLFVCGDALRPSQQFFSLVHHIRMFIGIYKKYYVRHPMLTWI